MYEITTLAILIALAVLLADRIGWIKAKSYRTGIFFGVLGILANEFRFNEVNTHVLVGIRDVPAIVAAFYFGPSAGIIAGVIAAVERFLSFTHHLGGTPWFSALSTLIVSLYAAGMSKFVFMGKRPPVIPAAIAATYGEILHLSLTAVLGFYLGENARMLEVLDASYSLMLIGAALAAGFSAFSCGSWRGWKKNFGTSLVFILVFFGISFIVIKNTAYYNATRQTCLAVVSDSQKLRYQFTDQINYILHCRAISLQKQIGTARRIPFETMAEYAAEYDVDEINIFTDRGELLASNRPEVLKNNANRVPLGVLKDFLALTDGKKDFVEQNFRPSRSDSSKFVKYVGIAFPDRKAFLQLGYTWNRLEREFSTFFFPMFSKTLIEEEGFFIITDQYGRIAAPVAVEEADEQSREIHANIGTYLGFSLKSSEKNPKELRLDEEKRSAVGKNILDVGLTKENWKLQSQNIFEARLFGRYGMCYRCRDLGEWRIYAFLPYTQFFTPAIMLICLSAFVLFAVCIVFRLVMAQIEKAQKKIDAMRASDLSLAATIQNSELPKDQFELDCCCIQAKMTPAKEVGGDFYDYYELSDGRVAVTIADVSGKGVPAAIFMMKAKNALKNFVSGNSCLAQSVELANQRLNRNNDAAMFVTAWVGIYDHKTGILEYVSAGHNPPIVLRKDGKSEWLKSAFRHKPLAAFPGSQYHSETILLAPGDRLYLYTDGVTEATNGKQELFGNDRLEQELKKARENLIGQITESLERFIAAAPVADDITMLTLEVKK